MFSNLIFIIIIIFNDVTLECYKGIQYGFAKEALLSLRFQNIPITYAINRIYFVLEKYKAQNSHEEKKKKCSGYYKFLLVLK